MGVNLHHVLMAARQKKGLTRQVVAEQAFLSYGTLSRIENGVVKDPHPHVLKSLATVLDLNYPYLMALANYIDNRSLATRYPYQQIPLNRWGENQSLDTLKSMGTLQHAHQYQAPIAFQLVTNEWAPYFLEDELLIVETARPEPFLPEFILVTKPNGQLMIAKLSKLNGHLLCKSILTSQKTDIVLLCKNPEAYVGHLVETHFSGSSLINRGIARSARFE